MRIKRKRNQEGMVPREEEDQKEGESRGRINRKEDQEGGRTKGAGESRKEWNQGRWRKSGEEGDQE